MTNEMLIQNMLTEVRDFNVSMMAKAHELYRSIDDQDSEEWQTAYQIFLDSRKAAEEAERALMYGMPGVE